MRTDTQGRFLLLRGKVQDVQITFANVYFLNLDHPQFLQDLLLVLLEFSEGLLVFGETLISLWISYWMCHGVPLTFPILASNI